MKDTIRTEHKGYTADIRYSEADGLLVGHVAGIRAIIGFHGESVGEVRKAFEDAVDFYLDTEPNPEKPFSGRITLQLTPEAHAELYRKAQEAGADSFDEWFANKVTESVLHHAF